MKWHLVLKRIDDKSFTLLTNERPGVYLLCKEASAYQLISLKPSLIWSHWSLAKAKHEEGICPYNRVVEDNVTSEMWNEGVLMSLILVSVVVTS